MKRSNGVFGVVKLDSAISIPSNKSVVVDGITRLTVPIASRVAYLSPVSNLPEGIEVTPGLVSIDNDIRSVSFEVHNHNSQPCRMQSGSLVCELQQTQVEDPETQELTREQFLEQFSLTELDSEQKQNAENLLWNWRKIFSHGSMDIGCAETYKHRIDLNDAVPFKDRCRRIPPRHQCMRR